MHCAPRTRSVGRRPRRGSQQILLTRGHQHWERGHKTDGRRSGLKEAETPFNGDKESVLAGKGRVRHSSNGPNEKRPGAERRLQAHARDLGGAGQKEGANCGACARRLARRVDGSSSAPSLVVKRDRHRQDCGGKDGSTSL
ncbi:hypothetical protein ERJ75_000585800 [Trypanosoma vivax]|nr:hypothetical protein ERJ75_000585800 [Trypanosoma vivax]